MKSRKEGCDNVATVACTKSMLKVFALHMMAVTHKVSFNHHLEEGHDFAFQEPVALLLEKHDNHFLGLFWLQSGNDAPIEKIFKHFGLLEAR
jgi:hypothetical protein